MILSTDELMPGTTWGQAAAALIATLSNPPDNPEIFRQEEQFQQLLHRCPFILHCFEPKAAPTNSDQDETRIAPSISIYPARLSPEQGNILTDTVKALTNPYEAEQSSLEQLLRQMLDGAEAINRNRNNRAAAARIRRAAERLKPVIPAINEIIEGANAIDQPEMRYLPETESEDRQARILAGIAQLAYTLGCEEWAADNGFDRPDSN